MTCINFSFNVLICAHVLLICSLVLILKMWPVELYLLNCGELRINFHNILINGHVVLINSLFNFVKSWQISTT